MDKMVKILEKKENLIEVELLNEDHSLCNVLKDILLNKEGVLMASYSIDHPVLDPDTGRCISNPKLLITTEKGVNAEEVLKEALKDLIKMCDELLQNIN
ncbi:DNA-directed RNA polymerase subunit L [Methanotorris formicicus]|uniref:DNA-directed RNA polymerase subunit Rpo11 n=1 Tax=Methanotorris formicicus Mc-S-70 TaxID=647171 RepID=H1KZ11_9EURY|nr:DNA-directed RNA polymerase subunit L [Methanotorris formicicus]EHP86591.1 RNA polymerase dimerization [Methanotorris formicicus Mc-S-70]